MIVVIFLLAQFVGLVTVNKHIEVGTNEDGTTEIIHKDTILGPQPEVEDKNLSFIPIMIMILVGTGILFILIRFSLGNVWKYWFMFSVWITVAIALGVYIPSKWIAITLGLILALLKVFKKNIITHNISEIFIYTGITIIILPLLNLVSAFGLLVLISIYDMIAVWKSKHMIKLAKFQTNSKLFAGISIPYDREGNSRIQLKEMENIGKSKKATSVKTAAKIKKSSTSEDTSDTGKSAILGGGDIAFPLMFGAAVMEYLILNEGLSKGLALSYTITIPILAGASLLGLLLLAKKGKFYPAMPFISAGCFLGYGIIALLI